MLKKITFDNFRSFKNHTEIDFTKTNYTMLPQNVADNGILKGGIFVGANASGKSTVILAMKLLLDFLFSENDTNSDMHLCLFGTSYSYSLSYEFLIQDKIIKYTLIVDVKKSFLTEKLFVDNILMMERMGLSAKSYIADENGVSYDQSDVGKNTLFLRTLYFNTKFASNSILSDWMEYLKKSIYINMFQFNVVNLNVINPYLIAYDKSKVKIKEYLEDNGCDSINRFFDTYHFEQRIEYEHSAKGGFASFTVGDSINDKYIFFKRRGIDVPIPYSDESMGNQNLLLMLPSFLRIVENGGMLLIDEFSSGFHNDLEKLLVRYFMENSNHAQLFFVSHSTNLLSNFILRPDQEWGVEFDGEEGSKVKRFSSEQPRAAQNIEKMYVSGVFGSLPRYKEVEHEAE